MLNHHTYKTILHTLHIMYISIDTKNVLTELILHITIIITIKITQKNVYSDRIKPSKYYPV